MNIRFALLIWLALGVPLWHGLLTGSLDPDEAAIRLIVAGVIALVVEAVVRGFVGATRPAAPAPAAPAGRTEGDTSSNIT